MDFNFIPQTAEIAGTSFTNFFLLKALLIIFVLVLLAMIASVAACFYMLRLARQTREGNRTELELGDVRKIVDELRNSAMNTKIAKTEYDRMLTHQVTFMNEAVQEVARLRSDMIAEFYSLKLNKEKKE